MKPSNNPNRESLLTAVSMLALLVWFLWVVQELGALVFQ